MTTLRRVTSTARAAGVAAAVGLLAASCSTSQAPSVPGSSITGGPQTAGSASRQVLPLNKIATLRSIFNRADNHPRLILIFSPT
jgi:hypothetical protein